MLKFLKALCILFLFMLFQLNAHAELLPDVIYAVTPEEITYENLSKGDEIDLYVIKTGKLSDELELEHGEKIKVVIRSYIPPKRGRRNGFFKVKYTGKEVMYGRMKMSEPVDAKEIALTAGGTIAGIVLHVPGLTQAAAAAKGLILPNENQTRLESAGRNAYNSTPLKYAEKGREFEAPAGSIVVLILK